MVIQVDVLQGVQSPRLGNFKYLVKIPDLLPGIGMGFSKISGLSFGDVNSIEYREGTDVDTPSKHPGLTNYPDVTFERGVAFDLVGQFLEEWHSLTSARVLSKGMSIDYATGAERAIYLKNVEVYAQHRGSLLGRALRLNDAWVRNIELADLDATGDDILIETFTLVHHGMTRMKTDMFGVSLSSVVGI